MSTTQSIAIADGVRADVNAGVVKLGDEPPSDAGGFGLACTRASTCALSYGLRAPAQSANMRTVNAPSFSSS